MEKIRLRAFAKINLGLRVERRRPDGYHDLRTIYQTISLCDRLAISLAPGIGSVSVECSDPSIPSGYSNLVYRTCDLWRRNFRFRGGIRVMLVKRIPVGSGLGGGSSDAAATLVGLERLTGDRLGIAGRLQLAAAIGSDVPLFLWGGRVLGVGRGEQVYPLQDLPPRHCLVIFPGFSLSTAEVFRELDRLRGAGSNSPLTKPPARINIKEFGARPLFSLESWGPAENDFEKVVFAKWPELAKLKRQLIRAGAETAALTGSGSAVFAIFDSAPKLKSAFKFVPAAWQMIRTRTVGREMYERLHLA